MSILLPKGKSWQKVEGYVKIRHLNNLFRSASEEWIYKTTLIPFPLDDGEYLDLVFTDFVSYDLNSKAVQKIEVIGVKDVKIV
jgi:hypothetical protein